MLPTAVNGVGVRMNVPWRLHSIYSVLAIPSPAQAR
jgi:hypothetical protein